MSDLTKVIDELVKLIPEEYQTTVTKIRSAISYLRKYGYLQSIRNITIGDIVGAVTIFQQIAGLKQDGVIGPKTLKAMEWPRCQLADFGESARIEKAKWGTKELRYYIARRDSDLSSSQWAGAMELAFKHWSDVANLKFERVDSSSSANLVISVGTGSGDGFDGSGGTLAWAQLPPNDNYRGQLLTRFDTAETWVLDRNQRGILLVNVACHEFGHLLGLEHSRVSSALMAPFYNPNVDKPQANDDISRIRALYGPPVDKPDDPTPPDDPTDPTPPPSDPGEGIEIILKVSSGVQGIKIPGYTIKKN